MVVPRTLVFGIGEESMLEHLQIFFDKVEWEGIDPARLVLVDQWHQFAAIVPSRVVGEVTTDDLLGHIALPLDELFRLGPALS